MKYMVDKGHIMNQIEIPKKVKYAKLGRQGSLLTAGKLQKPAFISNRFGKSPFPNLPVDSK